MLGVSGRHIPIRTRMTSTVRTVLDPRMSALSLWVLTVAPPWLWSERMLELSGRLCPEQRCLREGGNGRGEALLTEHILQILD